MTLIHERGEEISLWELELPGGGEALLTGEPIRLCTSCSLGMAHLHVGLE